MNTIDIPTEVTAAEQPQQQAMTVRDAITAIEKSAAPQPLPKTSQEMRVIEVSEALLPAYQKASTLELSDTEVEALMAPFQDSVVEVRPHDGLLYIPHIHVSDRLNKIFKPGKWALVRRREWFDADSSTMFGEYVLVIRGCYVGESVGGHPYAKNNPKVNFSDVLESTAAEALRRICGKRLSCGSQVWNPEYCRQWEQKYRVSRNGKFYKQSTPVGAQQSPPPPPAPATPPPSQPQTAKPGVFPTVSVVSVVEHKGTGRETGKPYTLYKITFDDGFGKIEASTFDAKIAELANNLSNMQVPGRLVTSPGKKAGTMNITSLEAHQPSDNDGGDQVPMDFDEQGNAVTP